MPHGILTSQVYLLKIPVAFFIAAVCFAERSPVEIIFSVRRDFLCETQKQKFW
jgi:hypothetical protein